MVSAVVSVSIVAARASAVVPSTPKQQLTVQYSVILERVISVVPELARLRNVGAACVDDLFFLHCKSTSSLSGPQ